MNTVLKLQGESHIVCVVCHTQTGNSNK